MLFRSIPIVIFGSTVVLKMMEKFPVIITFGAALLGWIAGEMLVTDPAIVEWVKTEAQWLASYKVAAAVGAGLVLLIGKFMMRGHANNEETVQ